MHVLFTLHTPVSQFVWPEQDTQWKLDSRIVHNTYTRSTIRWPELDTQ